MDRILWLELETRFDERASERKNGRVSERVKEKERMSERNCHKSECIIIIIISREFLQPSISSFVHMTKHHESHHTIYDMLEMGRTNKFNQWKIHILTHGVYLTMLLNCMVPYTSTVYTMLNFTLVLYYTHISKIFGNRLSA